MTCQRYICVFGLLAIIVLCGCQEQQRMESGWKVHDMARPQPPVVTPGITDSAPPANAVVLFDGTGFDQWQNSKGGPVQWDITGDAIQVKPGTGAIRTKKGFGDCQLHIEWSAPIEVEGTGQKRGNSGVFLMSNYEVQVLDCFDNTTYPDGQAGAIYGQYPPMFNVSRAPGHWQSYDIIFRRPRFNEDGSLNRPGRMTVLHNGVVIQDNVEIQGATAHKTSALYKVHPDKLPIVLQDHSDLVRFRNIWVVELPDIQTYDIQISQ